MRVIDFLGGFVTLPMQQCHTRQVHPFLPLKRYLYQLKSQVFYATLQIWYKDHAGQQYIDRGDYDVTSASDEIKAISWMSHVRAGIVVKLNAII